MTGISEATRPVHVRIAVPGVAGSPPPPAGILVGIGVFAFAITAGTAWIAATSLDVSLWAVPVVMVLLTGGFLSSLLSNHLGRAGTVLVTRRGSGWAVLSAPVGRWSMVVASVGTMLVSVTFLLLTRPAHIAVWLLAAMGVAGLLDAGRKLTNPVGVYLDPAKVTVVSPRSVDTFAWDELRAAELARRGLTIVGARGQAVLGYGEIASDPAVVAAVLYAYRANPGIRSELADERFVARLRSGQL